VGLSTNQSPRFQGLGQGFLGSDDAIKVTHIHAKWCWESIKEDCAAVILGRGVTVKGSGTALRSSLNSELY
jgi:hypothetical protein